MQKEERSRNNFSVSEPLQTGVDVFLSFLLAGCIVILKSGSFSEKESSSSFPSASCWQRISSSCRGGGRMEPSFFWPLSDPVLDDAVADAVLHTRIVGPRRIFTKTQVGIEALLSSGWALETISPGTSIPR